MGVSSKPLVDPFGRRVRDLRISVTDRCNFRCQYCMPEEGMVWLPRDEVLTFEEIERVARVCVERSAPTCRSWSRSWPGWVSTWP